MTSRFASQLVAAAVLLVALACAEDFTEPDGSPPTVRFATAVQSNAENVTPVTVTVHLSTESGRDVTVPYTVSVTSTATGDGADYTLGTGSPLTIAAGETTATISLMVVNDALHELDETIVLNLGTPTNATVGATPAHTVTIRDDDLPPTVALGALPASIVEAAGVATVTATLSATSGLPVTVTLGFTGTATATTDYTLSGMQVVVPAGSTTGTATITAVQDGLDEADETVVVDITGVMNGTESGTQRATVTIVDGGNPESSETLVGAGDIATCGDADTEATAQLLDSIAGTVFTAGDNAYPDGTAQQFADCYDPTWGRHKARTRPSPGNHDYKTAGASAYFAYFGASAGPPDKGYYSYDLGSWHVIALNSEIDVAAGSPQLQWLASDLAAHPTLCTVAYWHQPRFSSGDHGNNSGMQALWQVLYNAGVDIVLNGHDHNYERFAPQMPSGAPDPAHGIREFVVGTGGKTLRSFATVETNSEVRNSDTYGVLKLTLRSTSYDWEFIPAAGGQFVDVGNGTCHP